MSASPAILKGLAEALDDEDPGVQMAAAASLVEFGQKAIPVLIDRLETSDLQVSARISKVLQDIAAAEKRSSQ